MTFQLSIIICALLASIKADVSHLKMNGGNSYLPPDLPGSHQEASEQYIISRPKTITARTTVRVPQSGLHKFIADSPLKQPLFTPVFSDSLKQSASDPIVYAAATNSVFQTQINVQSQGSEFNSPTALRGPDELESEEEAEEERIRHYGIQSRSKSNGQPRSNQNYGTLKSYGSDYQTRTEKSCNQHKHEDHSRINNDKNHRSNDHHTRCEQNFKDDGKINAYQDGDRSICNDHGPDNKNNQRQDQSTKNVDHRTSHIQRECTKNAEEGRQNCADQRHSAGAIRDGSHKIENHRPYDVTRRNDQIKSKVNPSQSVHQRSRDNKKSGNYQGVNLINGNIAADQASKLLQGAANSNGNTQGINILNGSILRSDDKSRSSGHRSITHDDSYRAYDRDYQKRRNSKDDKRSEHDLKFSPSEPVFELIYKSGDEIDFSEAKLVDFADNHRQLENYKYPGVKGPLQKGDDPQVKSKVLPHVETKKSHRIAPETIPQVKAKDSNDGGYHYSKPIVSFDS